MNIIIVSDHEEVNERAADFVIDRLKGQPGTVLGLATGSTPEGLYRRLVGAHQSEGLDFSGVTTFNLDEYVGLGPDDQQSYRYYMDRRLFEHVNVDPDRTHVPDGLATDLAACCRSYEDMISSSGGIDLQVLGIGRDGHLGFNEPGSSLRSRTRVVVLAPETIEDNSRFFASEDDVPRSAISMGLGTITDARSCLMLASGEAKAEAVRRCAEGPVTSMTPASVLQMHPDATVIIDEAAASGLERLSYYRWVQKAARQLPLKGGNAHVADQLQSELRGPHSENTHKEAR